MATQVKLKAERRSDGGKGTARKLRASGKLPAVVYGADFETLSLTIDAHEAVQLFHSISVDNTLIQLVVEGESTPLPTLVREIQTHPFRDLILHVDFYRVQSGVTVELEVPLHLVGTPAGVRDQGGVLDQVFHELPVACIPSAIPESFELDVSALEIGDSLSVSDLDVPDGVEILLDLDRTLTAVGAPTTLASQDEDDEEDEDAEPEVIGQVTDEDETPES
ncbi:MAG: 50S ribosomal protein L25 [Gemmatimonadales bacterium]|nr:MAG: 50S ribosomal protein L25 [Gemmatimonadales bacterium]